MHMRKAMNLMWVVILAGAAWIFNCTASNDWSDSLEPEGTGPGPVTPGCDPDNAEACAESFFSCTEDEAGNKRCETTEPQVPDDGEWSCQVVDDRLVCQGDHMPAEGSGWECHETADGGVECERPITIPDGGDDGPWSCYYVGDLLVCESGEGTEADGDGDVDGDIDGDVDGDIDGDGDGDVDGDIDGDVDGDGDGDGDHGGSTCVCIPGAMRYCDDPQYCSWAVQYCNPDGMSWGPCQEAPAPAGCGGFFEGPFYDEECCIDQGYCCQDYEDLDRDGDTDESMGNCQDITCE